MLEILERSTRLQSIVIFPAAILLVAFVEPLTMLWLSGRLDDPQVSIPAICWLARILVIGVAARCLSEAWMAILNGAGLVRKYALVVLAGGLLNPLLAWLALSVLPEPYRFASVAVVFSVLLVVVHLVGIPIAVSKQYRISFGSVLAPLSTPAIAAITCWSIGLAVSYWPSSEIARSAVLLVVFTFSYACAVFMFLIDEFERRKLRSTIRKWFKNKKAETIENV